MTSGFEYGMLVRLSHLFVVRDTFTLHVGLVETDNSLLKFLVVIKIKVKHIVKIILECFNISRLLLDLDLCAIRLLVETSELQLHILHNQIEIAVDNTVVLLLILHLSLLLL